MGVTADWGWRRMTHLEEGECPVDQGQEDFLVDVEPLQHVDGSPALGGIVVCQVVETYMIMTKSRETNVLKIFSDIKYNSYCYNLNFFTK